jgi:hypothetical protein
MRSIHTAYATREEDSHETNIHMVPISDNDSQKTGARPEVEREPV